MHAQYNWQVEKTGVVAQAAMQLPPHLSTGAGATKSWSSKQVSWLLQAAPRQILYFPSAARESGSASVVLSSAAEQFLTMQLEQSPLTGFVQTSPALGGWT